ncbi:MAG: hypothetical protein PHU98_06245 [Mariniphaga sp.]|nr:hypothetical protein [Mariniphaga sp.]
MTETQYEMNTPGHPAYSEEKQVQIEFCTECKTYFRNGIEISFSEVLSYDVIEVQILCKYCK